MIKLLEKVIETVYHLYEDIRDHIIALYQRYLNKRDFVKSFAGLSVWCQQVKTLARTPQRQLLSLYAISHAMRIEDRLRVFNDRDHKLTYRLVFDIVSSVNYIKKLIPKL